MFLYTWACEPACGILAGSVLQSCFPQVGEYDLVVAMRTKLLEKWESRGFRRDILLSMALAQCGLATDTFAVQQVIKWQVSVSLIITSHTPSSTKSLRCASFDLHHALYSANQP